MLTLLRNKIYLSKEGILRNYLMLNVAMDIREPEVAALVLEGEALVVDAEQGADRFRKGYDVICYQMDTLTYQQTLSQGIGELRRRCGRAKAPGKR